MNELSPRPVNPYIEQIKIENNRLLLPHLIPEQDYLDVMVHEMNNPQGIQGHYLLPAGKEKLQLIRAAIFETKPMLPVPTNNVVLNPGDVLTIPLGLATEAYLNRLGRNFCSLRTDYADINEKTVPGVITSLGEEYTHVMLRSWEEVSTAFSINHQFKEFRHPQLQMNYPVKLTYRRGDKITVGPTIPMSIKALQTGQSQQSISSWVKNLVAQIRK